MSVIEIAGDNMKGRFTMVGGWQEGKANIGISASGDYRSPITV